MLTRIFLILFAILLVTALLGDISVAGQSGGQTAAQFLKIDLGARATAMGGAGTADSRGAMASFWNPAGLTASDQGNLALGHVAWLQDVNLEYGAVAYPVNDRWVLNAAILYLGFGDVPGYDSYGDPTGNVSAYDFMGSVSAAMTLSDQWSAGLTGKYIRQQLDTRSGTAFATDLGIKYQAEKWSAALVIADLGSSVKFVSVKEPLPSEIRLGFSANPFPSEFTWSMDFSHQFHGGARISNGVEYGFENRYFIRGGLQMAENQASSGWQESFSTGLGVLAGNYQIDYSFMLRDSMTGEDLHRFSVALTF